MTTTISYKSPCIVPGIVAGGVAAVLLIGICTQGQPLPASVATEFTKIMGARVEALNILGGDYGVSGGSYATMDRGTRTVKIDVSKFGGEGEVGDPRPLTDWGLAWQPELMGNMGYLTAKSHLHTVLQDGDVNEFDTFAIQFGGGARFWFGNHLSLAPTIMGMYGHTEDDYTANNAFTRANFARAKEQGLVDWDVNTWTVRPAVNLQYAYTWHRTIFTLSSDFTYYHTESFDSSSTLLDINGDSESWRNKIDVDMPLGKGLFGHELRTGGYFSRTELYDNLKSGLNTDHMYDLHGRLVLDFLGRLWKVRWIGVGASYLWGSNFEGWSAGADVQFKF